MASRSVKVEKPAQAPARKAASAQLRSSKRDSELRKVFGEYEVVDATTALHIQPQQCDIDAAVRGDPCNCAFSRACQRMYGSKFVLFFSHVAYVDLLDEGGARKIFRFRIEKAAREFIKAFDAGEEVTSGGFRLSPPPPSYTLEGLAKQGQRDKARRREALLKGETYEPDPRFRNAGVKSPGAERLRNFRHGTGMVHFPKAAA
jgi:hypothetical protein